MKKLIILFLLFLLTIPGQGSVDSTSITPDSTVIYYEYVVDKEEELKAKEKRNFIIHVWITIALVAIANGMGGKSFKP